MRRGPSRTGYLNIPGTSACPENTSLHRENFVRIDKLHARAAQHDSDGAILLGRQVDRALDSGFLDIVSAHPIVKTDFREDLRDVFGPFGFGFDLQRTERHPLLSQDRHDIRCGARHHGEESGLHGARAASGFRLAAVEEELVPFIRLRPKAHLLDVDQVGLQEVRRLSQVAALDELRSEPAKLVIRPAHRMPVRPRVIINAAMSVDGKIALSDGKAVRLSNEEDLRRVHRLRAEADAILVGVGTVLMDDPKLTVKAEYAKGRNPLRVVLDSDGKTPENAHVLDGTAPTLIVTSADSTRTFPRAEVLRCGKDEVDLALLLDHLASRGIKTVLVEGGSTVMWSFLRHRLADELKVFISSRVLGGHAAPTLAGGQGVTPLDEAPGLRLDRIERLGDGALLEYTVVR